MSKIQNKGKMLPTRPGMGIDSFGVEPLESRQLLSAGPWSQQDKQIGLDQASQNYPNITGAGETVVVLDAGVDYNHPALGGGYGNKVIASWNFDTNSADTFPTSGADAHGTGTAGAIAADPHFVDGVLQQGVAPGVKLISLRASGTYNTQQAIDWVINHRAQYNIVALNYLDMSGADMSQFEGDLQTLKYSGVFMAGAIGNYGPGPGYGFPGDIIHSVGSVDANNQLSGFTPRGSGLDLVAPGENVDVTWYYDGIHADLPSNGTSWTAPQVTGAAALIKQINPNFSADQIYQIIKDSATPVYDSYSNATYPMLNVNAALGLAYQESGQAHHAAAHSAAVAAPTPAPVATPPAEKRAKAVTAAPAPVHVTPTPVHVAAAPVVHKTPIPVAHKAAVAANVKTALTPFTGTAFSTGSTISAANYDEGGEGVAYHVRNAAVNSGDGYRVGGVHTEWSALEAKEVVTASHAGDWVDYTIDVAKTGSFAITARVSAAMAGGSFHIEIDGKKATGAIAVPTTGSLNLYANALIRGVKIKAGRHVMRIVMDKESKSGIVGNFESFMVK